MYPFPSLSLGNWFLYTYESVQSLFHVHLRQIVHTQSLQLFALLQTSSLRRTGYRAEIDFLTEDHRISCNVSIVTRTVSYNPRNLLDWFKINKKRFSKKLISLFVNSIVLLNFELIYNSIPIKLNGLYVTWSATFAKR